MTKISKGRYVDGFVIPVPKRNTAKYKKMAQEACRVWKKFGALDYKECIIVSVRPDKAVTLTFPKMARVRSGETVWFSYIVYRSRQHRNAVTKKVMSYFATKYGKNSMMSMPFDMKRFAYGGFKVMVSS